MGSGEVKTKLAIFGAGRVGTAMSLEMPGVPLVRRGEDVECELALICWPAQAVASFDEAHPSASNAHKVAFCNGVWACDDGADEQGCCYVRAVNVGDHAAPGYKGWRVSEAATAAALREAGLSVIRSVKDHNTFLWGKAIYIIPLALACDELDVSAREASNTELWVEWFNAVLSLAIDEVGCELIGPQIKRAQYLVDRAPKGWRPSSSKEEIAYFRGKLSCAD